jgi:hypothetical protein
VIDECCFATAGLLAQESAYQLCENYVIPLQAESPVAEIVVDLPLRSPSGTLWSSKAVTAMFVDIKDFSRTHSTRDRLEHLARNRQTMRQSEAVLPEAYADGEIDGAESRNWRILGIAVRTLHLSLRPNRMMIDSFLSQSNDEKVRRESLHQIKTAER